LRIDLENSHFQISEYNDPTSGEKGVKITNIEENKFRPEWSISKERSARGFAADLKEQTKIILEPIRLSELNLS
jgi:hypothetical protein